MVISRRWIRWLARLAVYGALAVLCLLLSSRWWLPVVLPGVLGQFDVRVASVERGPAGALLISQVVVETDAAQVRVDQVSLPNEVAYLRALYTREWSSGASVGVGQVSVQLSEGEAETGGADPPAYLPELYRTAQQGLALAERWVPPVRVDAVEISQGSERLVSLQAVLFADRMLEGNVLVPGLAGAVEFSANLSAQTDWKLALMHAESGISLDLGTDAGDGVVRAAGQIRRAASELAFSAEFGGEGWLPVRAGAASDVFEVDPAWLPAREGVVWERLRLVGVDLDWAAGRYRGSLRAEAGVTTEALGADELTADLALAGDLQTLRVETGEVLASWVALNLSEPVSINLRDGSVAAPAVVQAELDLAKQAFFDASGRVEARLNVAPALAGGPDIGFVLNAVDLGFRDYAVDRVELTGRLRGTLLSIEQAVIQPVATADESMVTASGVADLASRKLDFDYSLSLSADWLNAQIGQSWLAGVLKAEGRLSGVFDRPVVAGQLEPLVVGLPEMVPITVAGAYRLEGMDRLNLAATATANAAAIETALDLRLVDETVTVQLERFIWRDPARSTLELGAPVQLSYQFAGESEVPEARLQVAPFVLSGPDLGVEGQWNPATGLQVSLRNVSLERVGHWFDRKLPGVWIESVAVDFTQLRPKVVGSVAVAAEGDFAGDGVPLRLDLGAHLTTAGFSAETLQLNFADAPLIEGSLAAPVTFQVPAADGAFWNWSESGALEGALSGAVNPAFSDWLVQNTGVRVKQASLDLAMSGTLQNPVGRLNLYVDSLQSPIGGVPAMDRIELVVEGNPGQIEVERLNCLINKSELSGAFSLPVEGFAGALQGGAHGWRAWLADGTGRLELIDWEAEDWVDVLPAMMRRSGRLDGELELQPGWELRGSLTFDGFALRPTSSLPSIDSIGGQIELADRRLSIRGASARVGGSSVELAGWVDADGSKDLLWEVAVVGKNVPLVRTTDMILRSDLDLKGSRTERSETPMISGALNLRSSTLLAEFDPLAPNVESGPQSKPPYFSIADPAVADWRFDLKIAGDSFMRVRSPYFRSQLSANFDLGGTFAEPLLIGSVRTVGGEFSFPGGKMRITSGEAYIAPSQPNAVQLDFSGTAQKASQIISMRVTQTLDEPLIQFQSTPALSNAAIVRLLATGSATGGGVGAVGLYLGQGLLGAGGLDDQLSDRLTVDVGEETTRSGRNTVGARYDISEDYSVEGGYDVYDAYNLDFIWSIFKQ